MQKAKRIFDIADFKGESPRVDSETAMYADKRPNAALEFSNVLTLHFNDLE